MNIQSIGKYLKAAVDACNKYLPPAERNRLLVALAEYMRNSKKQKDEDKEENHNRKTKKSPPKSMKEKNLDKKGRKKSELTE